MCRHWTMRTRFVGRFVWVGLAALPMALPGSAAEPSRRAVKASVLESPRTAEQAMTLAAKQHKYLLLLLYGKEDTELSAMREAMSEAKKSLSKEAVLFELATGSAEAKAIHAKHGLERYGLPLFMTISPTGIMTRAFTSPPSTEELRQAMLSPAFAAVMKAIRDGKGILLTFTSKKLSDHRQCIAAINAFAADFKDVLTVVVADPDEDRDLAARCRTPVPLHETQLVVVLSGRILHQTASPQSKSDVATAFEVANSKPRGCCPSGGCGR